MTDIHSNADPYVVGALEPTEVTEYEQHLAECPECREEVAAMREITAQLSQTVATDPPASLRASILEQVASTPQDAADPVPVPGPRAGRHASPVAPAESAPAPEGSNVIPMKRSWAQRAPALLAAAAVICAIAVGGWAIQSRNAARDDTAAAQQQFEELTSALGATDVQTQSVVAAGGGTTTVVRSADQGVALLVATGMPDLPSDKAYEAWTFKKDGTPVAAGTFSTNGTHQLPAAGLKTSTVAVTVEPAGGVDAPTSDAIAVIDLS
jgi:anti-sigma-K factor RskA